MRALAVLAFCLAFAAVPVRAPHPSEESSSSTGGGAPAPPIHHPSSTAAPSPPPSPCIACTNACKAGDAVQCPNSAKCECNEPACEAYCPACTPSIPCQCDVKTTSHMPEHGFFPTYAQLKGGMPCYCLNCTCPASVVASRCSTQPNYSGRYNTECNCANQKCNTGYGCQCTDGTYGVLNAQCVCANCTAVAPCSGACHPECCVSGSCDTTLPGCEVTPSPPDEIPSDDVTRWYIIGGVFGGLFLLLAVGVTCYALRRRKPAGTLSVGALVRAQRRASRRRSTATSSVVSSAAPSTVTSPRAHGIAHTPATPATAGMSLAGDDKFMSILSLQHVGGVPGSGHPDAANGGGGRRPIPVYGIDGSDDPSADGSAFLTVDSDAGGQASMRQPLVTALHPDSSIN